MVMLKTSFLPSSFTPRIMYADGLSGIKESIAEAYPNTEYQHCIVHQVRNTLKYVAEKDKKAFANDLKSIYHAPNEESGYERMQSVTKKWQEKYPNAMRRWEENWDVLSPMFKFSAEVRKVDCINENYRIHS